MPAPGVEDDRYVILATSACTSASLAWLGTIHRNERESGGRRDSVITVMIARR